MNQLATRAPEQLLKYQKRNVRRVKYRAYGRILQRVAGLCAKRRTGDEGKNTGFLRYRDRHPQQ